MLLCRLGRHEVHPVTVWNDGYWFSHCTRCRRDMIKSVGNWRVVKGKRVVWRPSGSQAVIRRVEGQTAELGGLLMSRSFAPPAFAPAAPPEVAPATAQPGDMVERRDWTRRPWSAQRSSGNPGGPGTETSGSPALPDEAQPRRETGDVVRRLRAGG